MTADLYASRVLTGVLAGVVVAGALVLAGCTGEPEPVETPTVTDAPTTASPEPTETESPEPTETVTVPPLPEEAQENTPEGAEAFIRHYFEVVNLAMTTPQAGLADDLIDEECLSCQAMVEQVDELVRASERLKHPPYRILTMAPVGGGPAELQRFNMTLDIVANEYVTDTGEGVDGYDLTSYSGVGAATWREGRWLIYDIGLQES